MTAGNDRTVRLWNPHRDSDLEATAGYALLIKTYAGVHSHAVHDIAMCVKGLWCGVKKGCAACWLFLCF